MDKAKRISLILMIELSFQLNGTLCQGLVPYIFPLVDLHTISVVSFHKCMLEGSFELQ